MYVNTIAVAWAGMMLTKSELLLLERPAAVTDVNIYIVCTHMYIHKHHSKENYKKLIKKTNNSFQEESCTARKCISSPCPSAGHGGP